MINFLDLKSFNRKYDDEFKKAFSSFLNEGNYVLGNQVSKFENDFAKYCGTKYCVGLSSGLDALLLILEAYKLVGKLSEGDEVIVPANTYIASVLAISHKKLTPVFVEPDLDSYNINPNLVEQAISSKTKAILGVHLYGKLYNVNALEVIAKKHELILIEDAAQAHGSTF